MLIIVIMSYQEVSPQVVTAVNQDTSCKDCGSFAQSKHYIVQYHTLDIEKRIKLVFWCNCWPSFFWHRNYFLENKGSLPRSARSCSSSTCEWKPVFLSLFQNYVIPEEKAPNEAEDKDDEAKNNDLAIIRVKVFKFQI